MSSKKLFRWYKEILSGYLDALDNGELKKDNIKVKEQGETKEISVPVFEPDNMGDQLAIDEKNIDGETYTILSNRQSNKIIIMANTLKTKYLTKIISKIDINKRMNVKSISRDMASNYDWLARQSFMNAYHVIDKFHIIKNAIEQLQSVRIRYRQEELRKRRLAKENKEPYKEVVHCNGDTTLQLLHRGRWLLFSPESKWTEQQQKRAKILFEQYPQIKEAYKLVIKLRNWFTPPKGKKTYQKTKERKKKKLEEIINQMKNFSIEELKNIAFMLEKNKTQILNYFIAKETNAKAEALNSNLARFINVNYGARNKEFFLYRVKILFS